MKLPHVVLTAAVLVAFSVPASDARGDARADVGAAKASATCERAAGPGRVRCEAEIHVESGTVRWADVQVVETPQFVSALKGRIGPADATVREGATWRFPFGIVARARGTGDLKLRVRAVVCQGERCDAQLIEVSVPVASGT